MSNSGWIYDESEFRVTVDVKDNGTGALIATANYIDGPADFTNTYEAEPTQAQIVATKTLLGWNYDEIPFEFTLYDKETLTPLQTAKNVNGSIIFDPITYDQPGDYTYIIKETQSAMGGWTLDTSVYNVIVTVIDDLEGSLIATVTYPDGTLAFENSYLAIDGPAIITGTKRTTGKNLVEGQFTFGLFDSDDNLLQSTTNIADGTFTFDPISYTAEAVDTYYIKELSASGNGWTVDPTIFTAIVTIVDDREGILVVTVDYPDGDISFINTYTTETVDLVLNAIKLTKGAPLVAGVFKFGLFDESYDLLLTAFNDASGNVTFPKLTYHTTGTFNYIIKEMTPPGKGWTSDQNEFPVHVSINKEAGRLIAGVTYPKGTPTFCNIYKPCHKPCHHQHDKCRPCRCRASTCYTYCVLECICYLPKCTCCCCPRNCNADCCQNKEQSLWCSRPHS